MSDKIRYGLIAVLLSILLFCLIVYLIRDYIPNKSQENQIVNKSTYEDSKDSLDYKKYYDFLVELEKPDGDITKYSPEELRQFLSVDEDTKKFVIDTYGQKNRKQITPPERIILEYD